MMIETVEHIGSFVVGWATIAAGAYALLWLIFYIRVWFR